MAKFDVSGFDVTVAAVAEMLDDDPSLGTLKNQFEPQKVFDLIEDKGVIETEEDLYEALLDVMYATRPTGPT